MKLVLVSDTHTMHQEVKVPDGDVLVHAGDLTYTGRVSQFESALSWLISLPHRHKVVIAGNHDFGALEFFKKAYTRNEELTDAGVVFLHDWGCSIDGVKFWGSPYTLVFGRWAYMKERGEAIKRHWDLIPADTDVLITHGPPWGVLDVAGFVGSNEHLGCEELHDAVFERVRPKIHVFGHIHGGYGRRSKTKPYADIANIDFYNASVVDENYQVVNPPHVVEL